MPGPKNDIKALTWVFISAGGFILFLVMALLFSIYSDKLNLINSSAYFFLLVPLSLAAAGFLFGALRSHAKYSGKAYGGTLELGGPILVLVIVIYLGYKFRPADDAFTVTLNVFDSTAMNKPVNGGQLVLYYGTAHVSKNISEGQVILNEVPSGYKGVEMKIIPEVEGYSSLQQVKLIPVSKEPVNIYLQKLADTIRVSGIVLDERGRAVRQAQVVIADGLGRDSTDRFGNFHFILPLKDGTETRIRVYVGNELKYNALVILSNATPLSIQLSS